MTGITKQLIIFAFAGKARVLPAPVAEREVRIVRQHGASVALFAHCLPLRLRRAVIIDDSFNRISNTIVCEGEESD